MEKLKKYINIKNFIILILLFILFYCSPLLQLIPIKLLNLNIKNTSNRVIATTFSDTSLLLILIIIYKNELKNEFIKFKNNFLNNMDISVKYWLVGLFFMMISNIIINIIFKTGGANNEKSVQQMISSLPILMLLTAGIIAPIIEELLFRKGFKNAFLNKYLFIVLSGLVFGSLHVITSYNSLKELLYIIPYSSLGISFAAIYDKTKTIYSSIIMHILHNTILILLSIITL